MRRSVASASGRTARNPYFCHISSAVSKIDGQGSVQSIISAAVFHGFSLPDFTPSLSGFPCVGSGKTIG
jgi:hypothetical protein